MVKLHKHKILVVDDEEAYRTVLKNALEEVGYSVSIAKDGEEAIETLKSNDFELVITDILMPKTDGLELLKKIKNQNPSCKVIILTGEETFENAVRALRQNASDFIVKRELKMEQLKATVKKTFETSSQQIQSQKKISKLKITEETKLAKDIERTILKVVDIKARLEKKKSKSIILFADMADSTEYKEKRDLLQGLQKACEHNITIQNIITEYGGTIVKWIGDEIMARFDLDGNVKPHMAINAAIKIQEEFYQKNLERSDKLERFLTKIGIAIGKVVDFPEKDPNGLAVDIAARLQGLAKPEQILVHAVLIDVSDTTEIESKVQLAKGWSSQSLVSARMRRKLKGLQESVEICEIKWFEDFLTVSETEESLDKEYRIFEEIKTAISDGQHNLPSLMLNKSLELSDVKNGQAQLLLRSDERYLKIVASTYPDEVGKTVLIDNSVTGRAFKNRKEEIVYDVREDPNYKTFSFPKMKSELAVPIFEGGEPIAVINQESPLIGAFGKEHANKLNRLVDQPSFSIIKQLIETSELKRPLETREPTDSSEVIEKIMSMAMELVNANHGQFLFLDGNDLVIEFTTSSEPLGTRVKVHNSITGLAVLTRKTINIGDLSQESWNPLYNRYLFSIEAQSELATPVFIDQKVIGVINIESLKKNAFSKLEVKQVELYAQAASSMLRDTIKELYPKRYKAEDLDEMVSPFIHNLNSRVGILNVYANYVLDGLKNQEFESIKKNTKQMIQNLSRLSEEIEGFKPRLKGQINLISLRAVIESARKQTTISDNIDFKLESSIDFKRIQIPEDIDYVLSTLFQNACDAMSRSGKLTVSVSLKEKQLDILVKDTGTGIKKKEIDRIFEKGFSTKEEKRRMGEGLFNARKTVKSYNGAITLEHTSDKGSFFKVTLPLQKENNIYRFKI